MRPSMTLLSDDHFLQLQKILKSTRKNLQLIYPCADQFTNCIIYIQSSKNRLVPTWPCCHIIDEKLLVEQVIVLTLSLAHQGVENHKKSCKSKGIFDTFKRDHDSIKQFNKIYYDNGYVLTMVFLHGKHFCHFL